MADIYTFAYVSRRKITHPARNRVVLLDEAGSGTSDCITAFARYATDPLLRKYGRYGTLPREAWNE